MRRRWDSFRDNTDGSIAIFFAVALSVLLACIGGAIDYGRYAAVRTQTEAALDGAVLAGARALILTGDATAAIAAASTFYESNVNGRYATSNDTVTFHVGADSASITGSGTVHLPTTFLQVLGINQLSLIEESGSSFPKASITGTGGDVEVAVMLDLTGSMCDDGTGPCSSGTKLDALKTAAKDLVNIVVRDDQSATKSRVALVPFASRIRVADDGQGADIMKDLTNLNPTWSGWHRTCQHWVNTSNNGEVQNWECQNWSTQYQSNWLVRPCVTERFYEASGTMEHTDTAPGPELWLNGSDGRRAPLSRDSGSTPLTSDTGNSQSDPATHDTYGPAGQCWMPRENVVVPLTSDKSELTNRIDSYVGERQTGGALGTAFTWYMLSPNWADIWPSVSEPAPYSQLTQTTSSGGKKLRKVAVLMSDGVYNTYRSWSNQDQQQVSDYAKAYCDAMKAQGIEIYTVAFDLDSLSTSERVIAEDTLRHCGSDVSNFYNTLNPGELQAAFRDIAVQLTNISLTR